LHPGCNLLPANSKFKLLTFLGLLAGYHLLNCRCYTLSKRGLV
jgi:hypothetical protein